MYVNVARKHRCLKLLSKAAKCIELLHRRHQSILYNPLSNVKPILTWLCKLSPTYACYLIRQDKHVHTTIKISLAKQKEL